VTARPDPLIHPITRLSICGLLAAGADWVEFAALRDAAGISDSVLSKQSRVLEDAGYVEVRKGAVGRRPRTWFRLTAEGRQAVEGHLAWLAQLEEAVSASTRDVQQARPHSDMILHAMHLFSLSKPEEVVKVGDSVVDIEEGKNAGCGLTIGITTGAHTRQQLASAHPDHIIDRLNDLLPLMATVRT